MAKSGAKVLLRLMLRTIRVDMTRKRPGERSS